MPDEQLADPRLEARARAITSQLRCVVCQNQTIDDSDASLARDLRIIVRERLLAGDTDSQARAYIVDRYGSFVLLNRRSRARPCCCGSGRCWCWRPAASALASIYAGEATTAAPTRRR